LSRQVGGRLCLNTHFYVHHCLYQVHVKHIIQ